jgi:hypothetical protein
LEKKRSRPSQSKEWVTHSRLDLFLDDADELHHFTTDEHGNVQTKKRSWAKLHATVVHGTHITENSHITIPPETPLWYCVISSSGRCSSIGLANTEVTLILHKKK